MGRQGKIETLKQLGLADSSKEFTWSLKKAGSNQILLQERYTRLACHCHHFKKEWRIVSMDALTRLTVMGQELSGVKNGDWYWFAIPDSVLCMAEKEGYIEIYYEGTLGKMEPLVFLQGEFLVKSEGEFQNCSRRQVTCKGPFYLEDARSVSQNCTNLVETGFPFMKERVTVESRFWIGNDGICMLVSIKIRRRNYGDQKSDLKRFSPRPFNHTGR